MKNLIASLLVGMSLFTSCGDSSQSNQLKASPMFSLVGFSCTPTETGFETLSFIDFKTVEGRSDFGSQNRKYTLSTTTLTIQMFGDAKDIYSVEQGGKYLRADVQNLFKTDYRCNR